jgi:branched-chain amino acid transport system permease protein
MSLFIEQLFNGLSLAGIYLLIALGITLLFGITTIINFAQGELVIGGGFVAYALVQAHIPIAAALVISAVAIGVGSEVLDFGLFRRTLDRPLNGLIISLGLITLLEAVYSLIWPAPVYSLPLVLSGTVNVGGGIIISKERLLLIGVTAVLTMLVFLMLGKTKYGRGMRALSEDRMSARVLGVPVGILISLVFMLSSGLAALAGGLLGTIFPFESTQGTTLLLIGFAVAIVGGLGNVRGAVYASILLAFVQVLGGAYISQLWSQAFLVGAMIIVIVIRPTGFGTAGGHGDPLSAGFIALSNRVRRSRPRIDPVGRVLNLVPTGATGVVIVLLAFAPFILSSSFNTSLMTSAIINALVAYSFWFGFRYVGIFSIAQATFMGMGAYSADLVAQHMGWDFWAQSGVAVAAGAGLALIFGLIALRSSGSYFVIILFALSELMVNIAGNWSFVGGQDGLELTSSANPLGTLVDFSQTRNLYFLVLVVFLLTMAVLLLIRRTAFGARLRSVRDNETLAKSLGLNTYRHRLLALVISGGVAGVAGILFSYNQLGIGSSYFDPSASINFVLMVMVGGSETLLGPLVGALLVTFLPSLIHLGPYQSQAVYGAGLVLVILLLPQGIVGSIHDLYLRMINRGQEERPLLSATAVPDQVAA